VWGLMITGDLASLPIDLVAIVIFDAVMFVVASVGFKRIIE
jgi:ABC-2 type transport system permease protein